MNSERDFALKWLRSLDIEAKLDRPELVQLVSQIAKMSQERCQMADAQRQTDERQIVEYKAETSRLLSEVGHIWPRSDLVLDTLVKAVAGAALALDIDDESESNLVLRTSKLAQDKAELLMQPEPEEKDLKIVEAAKNLSRLKNCVSSINLTLKETLKKIADKKERNEKYFPQKIKDYSVKINSDEAKLDPQLEEIRHETLMKLDERLKTIKAQIDPLESKLTGYMDLPPDTNLALVKLNEAKQELSKLTDKLMEEISLNHL